MSDKTTRLRAAPWRNGAGDGPSFQGIQLPPEAIREWMGLRLQDAGQILLAKIH